MANPVLPKDLQGFEKQFNHIVNTTHNDVVSVFDDMLTYIIGAFNPEPKPNPQWKYTKEQNMMFHQLMQEWLVLQQKKVMKLGWYDAFGDLFMRCVSLSSKQYRGQFFTPHNLCQMIAESTIGEEDATPSFQCGGFGRRVTVNDPACGSARLLLAAHSISCARRHRPRYYIAEDIDRLCCKMAAINLCAHGCFGEVVCHDTLQEPECVTIGYIINEGMYPFPAFLTIRVSSNPDRFLATQIWKARKGVACHNTEDEEPSKFQFTFHFKQ